MGHRRRRLAVDAEPTPIWPSGTVNSGSSRRAWWQPSKATPRCVVAAFGRRGDSDDSGEIQPVLGRALAHVNTVKSPAMPRLFDSSPFGALAMSSVTAK